MSVSESFFPSFFSTLDNSKLKRQICRVNAGANEKTTLGLFMTLIESSLIVLALDELRSPDKKSRVVNQQGLAKYDIGTQISLFLLRTESGQTILPVFTDAQAMRCFGADEDFCCVGMAALDVLEMFAAAEADIVLINPGSVQSLEIPKSSVVELLRQLRAAGMIPEQHAMRKETPIEDLWSFRC